MPFNQNDQNYQTKNSRVLNYNDFSSNIGKEKEELKKLKRSQKNSDEIHQVPGNKQYKFNKVTHKIDDLSKDEIADKLDAIDGDLKKKSKVLEGYSEFVSMINESDVSYSDSFRELISKIDSPVAKYLTEIENKDYEITSNYFDISDKETITFTPDKKAQKILSDDTKFVTFKDGRCLKHSEANDTIFKLLGYEPKGDKSYQPEEDESGEVISKAVSPSSDKTYLYVKFGGGECVLSEDKVLYEDAEKAIWRKNRQPIRVGRGIRALVNSAGGKFTDAQYEEFVNKYKSTYDRLNGIFKLFELVKGDDIAHWYDYSNYAGSSGTLNNSCMSRVSDTYFEIYVSNPDVCNLLILKSDENPKKIVGRALVWNLQTPKVGMLYMDRVYTHDDSDVELFREYAKSMGIFYKNDNSSCADTDMVNPKGEIVDNGEISVRIKPIYYSRYPYLDTLRYLNEYSSDYYILSTDNDGYDKELTDTGGGWEGASCDTCNGDGEVECPECEGSCTVDCDECDGNGSIDCDTCDGDGKIECNSCDGEGETDADCEECDGTGEVDDEECSKCEGSGTIKEECGRCDGDGKLKCRDCNGEGDKECPECDGEGDKECPECDGNGTVSCPECGF